ncbi:MAG: glutathione S-transferase N-terminal domain-containing protein [Candidatus Nealsonbacteria bacterium]|nr:glutathione S-transferase N-terminal domain-containing protein [Candidatus Nealsonbacteria bacterium]
MNKKIRIFTTPACPYCFTLMEFFKERNIEFEEIDVSQDEKAKEEMITKSGKMEVPIVEIDGEIVIGFDRPKVLDLLGIKD